VEVEVRYSRVLGGLTLGVPRVADDYVLEVGRLRVGEVLQVLRLSLGKGDVNLSCFFWRESVSRRFVRYRL
jgi:hypothetical protein